MKIIVFGLLILTLAIADDKLPHLSGSQQAQLYKALADSATASANAVQAQATAKAKADALAELRTAMEKVCGGSLIEPPNELVDCAPPPPKGK